MTTQPLSKADLHIHTFFSDGLMSPETLVEYVVEKTDLRVIAITDHDTVAGSLVAQAYWRRFPQDFGRLEVITGAEVTSADGDILALFIEDDIPPGLSAAETVERIHAQGGLAVAAHPYAFMFGLLGLDGMKGVGDQISTVDFDGVEVRNATPSEFFSNRRTGWVNRKARRAATGGSDTHYLPTVGSTYTLFPGTTSQDLRHAIETCQTRAGGREYSPFLIQALLRDLFSRRLPYRHINAGRAADWPLWADRPA